jgi:serine/threonine-protein phosphatase 5
MGDSETSSARCLKIISEGGCPLDITSKPEHMPLPIIPDDPNAKYTPTKEFVEGMIESFKQGGKVPKRVAWEIILGVQQLVVKEKSLVEVEVHKGATCDVVGDSEYLMVRGACELWIRQS